MTELENIQVALECVRELIAYHERIIKDEHEKIYHNRATESQLMVRYSELNRGSVKDDK